MINAEDGNNEEDNGDNSIALTCIKIIINCIRYPEIFKQGYETSN
jgi:hypothetical protein